MLRLLQKALAQRRLLEQLLAQQMHENRTFQPLVLGAIDDGQPALAEPSANTVALV